MALIQYGGSLGLTTDFMSAPNVAITGALPIIGVYSGGSGLSGPDIMIGYSSQQNISSDGMVLIGNKLYVQYWTGSTLVKTAAFGNVKVISTNGRNPGGILYPSPQQPIEISFLYGTYDTVANTVASDGSITVYVNSVVQFTISGIPLKPRGELGQPWKHASFGPFGWATSYYVKQDPSRVAGYGGAGYDTPFPIDMGGSDGIQLLAFTYPIPADFVFPIDVGLLDSGNFSQLDPINFFLAPSRWRKTNLAPGGLPTIDNTASSFSGQSWTVSANLFRATASGYMYTVGQFNPHTVVPPPPAVGTLIVQKVTIPSIVKSFNFTAGGGLTPATFALSDGQSITYPNIPSGGGYSIAETPDPAYDSALVTSNGSPADNIVIGDNQTVILTATNTPVKLTGKIIVTKVSSPAASAKDIFNFTAGGGLYPSIFSLKNGESQVFDNLNVEQTYSIAELPNPNYNTTTVVSNGSPLNAITVGDNEVVTVTFSNAFTGPKSGIYYIKPGKTNDSLYGNIGAPGDASPITIVPIPNPFWIH